MSFQEGDKVIIILVPRFYSVLKNLVLWVRSETDGSAVDLLSKKTNVQHRTPNVQRRIMVRLRRFDLIKKSEATSTFDIRC